MSNRYHEEVVWGCAENEELRNLKNLKELRDLMDLMESIKNSLDRIGKTLAECEEILERK